MRAINGSSPWNKIYPEVAVAIAVSIVAFGPFQPYATDLSTEYDARHPFVWHYCCVCYWWVLEEHTQSAARRGSTTQLRE